MEAHARFENQQKHLLTKSNAKLRAGILKRMGSGHQSQRKSRPTPPKWKKSFGRSSVHDPVDYNRLTPVTRCSERRLLPVCGPHGLGLAVGERYVDMEALAKAAPRDRMVIFETESKDEELPQ